MAESLRDLVARVLGVATQTYLNRSTSSLGTTVAQVLRQDPSRVAAILCNLSANNIYVAPEPSPSSARGYLIPPNGGTMRLVWFEDFDLVGYEWRGIADLAASGLYTLELVVLRAAPEA